MDHAAHLLPLVAGHGDAAGAAALAGTLFLAGALGGLTHCAPMCGPFVLAQVSDAATPGAVLRRLSGGLALPYHAGRMTTYGLLGAIAGGLGGAVAGHGPFRWLLAGFLLLAAGLFAAQAVPAVKERDVLRGGSATAARLGAGLARVVAPLLRPRGHGLLRGYGLGLALGFLPCGFLYGALAAAAGSGSAVGGGAAMLAFALGTTPSLWSVGLAGTAAAQRWRGVARSVAAPLFLFNALALTAMAIRAIA